MAHVEIMILTPFLFGRGRPGRALVRTGIAGGVGAKCRQPKAADFDDFCCRAWPLAVEVPNICGGKGRDRERLRDTNHQDPGGPQCELQWSRLALM